MKLSKMLVVTYISAIFLLVFVLAQSQKKSPKQDLAQPKIQIPSQDSIESKNSNHALLTVDSQPALRTLEIKPPPMPNMDEIDLLPEEKTPKEPSGPQIVPGELFFVSKRSISKTSSQSEEILSKLRKSVEESTRGLSVGSQDIQITKFEPPTIEDSSTLVNPSLLPSTYQIKIAGLDSEATMEVLQSLKEELGETVIPNYQFSIRLGYELPVLPNLQQVKAPAAQVKTQGRGALVAVLDTGIYPYHMTMLDRVIPGFNTYDNNTNTQDQNGHGTAVAGVIAGMYTGIAPQGKVLAVKVANDQGTATFASIFNGIDYAYRTGAKIVNLSIGGELGPKNNSTAIANFNQISQFLQPYQDNGVIFVGAAPNSNSSRDLIYDFPSSFPQFIAVSAVDSQNRKATFASFGKDIFQFAPGVNVTLLQTTNSNTDSYYTPYRTDSGTSFSTPHISGAVALLSSLPNYVSNVNNVKNLLKQYASPILKTILNNGTGLSLVLNAENTVKALFTDPPGACGAKNQKCCAYGMACRTAGLICSDKDQVPYPGKVSNVPFSDFTCKLPSDSISLGLGHSCGFSIQGSSSTTAPPCDRNLRCANSGGLSSTIGVARPPFFCQK